MTTNGGERPRGGGDLFLCFTSKSSSSMRLSSPTPPLPPSLSRRVGSVKGGQSPATFSSSASRRKAGSLEEPTSPKVTCIGQVRVKTSRKKKKMRSRSRRGGGGGELSFRREEGDKRWVHLPLGSICEAVRAFGSEMNCFVPCGSEKREKKRPRAIRIGSCGAALATWMAAMEEGERVEEIDLRREREERVVEVFGGEEEKCGGEVPVCVPPKNALLLMRCRSDPVRMSALANRFWGSPVKKVEEDECVDDNKLESFVFDHEVEKKIETISESRDEKDFGGVLVEASENEENPTENGVVEEEDKEAKELNLEEEEEGKEAKVEEKVVTLEETRVEEEANVMEEEAEKENIEETKQKEKKNRKKPEERERRLSFSRDRSGRRHSFSTDRDARRSSSFREKEGRRSSFSSEPRRSSFSSEKEARKRRSFSSEKKVKELEKVKETEEQKRDELPDCLLMMMCEPKLSMEVSKETWVCTADFVRHHRRRRNGKPKPEVALAPEEGEDKQTSTLLIMEAGEDKQKSTPIKELEKLRTVASQPPPSAPAEMIKPVVASVATTAVVASYGPFVLTRCKSEPMRSSAKLSPEACFWKSRHQPISTAGLGF